MSRYLVTGAFGAIGVWTMRSLLDRGHEVVSFDIGEQAPRLPLALTPEQAASVTRVRGDIGDLNAVERALDEYAITHVIHLAALQVPFVRADPPPPAFTRGVLGRYCALVGSASDGATLP